MPKRKAVEPALRNWSDVDMSLARLCQIEAQRKRLEARLNELIENARSTYAPELEDIGKEDAALRAELQQFALARRQEFEPRKSVERLHGALSFRTAPPSVQLVSRKWTWKKVLKAIEDRLPMFLRQKQEVDKDAILADYAAQILRPADLAAVGLKVGQEETFGIELKYEEAPENTQ